MKKIYILSIALIISLISIAQKPEKVFASSIYKAMATNVQADKDEQYNKAKADFKKILTKDKENAMAYLGLAMIYSDDKYSKKDYFEAYKYFQIAYDKQAGFTSEQLEVLNEYFFKRKKTRRNRPIKKNMDWERDIVEDKLIKYVREENKVEIANRFLEEFPESKFVANVEHIRTYIDYRTAENTNTVEAYNGFLKQYPEAAQKEIAIAKRNKIAYKKALGLNSLSALRAFVKEYPDAIQVEDARKLMSTLAYAEVAKSRNLEALENFMREYPNSTKMPEAKILKKQLLYEKAKNTNTIEAYNEFVALYPEGSHYIDIFNLKAGVLGEKVSEHFPFANYHFVKGYDNQDFDDFGGAAIQRPNGEIVLVTNSKATKDKMYDTWLLGLNQEGKMVWNSFLGNEFDDFANHVVVNNKNEIFVAGITNAIKDSIPGQSWLYKLAPDGSNVYNAKLEGTEVLALGIFEDGSAIISSKKRNEADSADISFIAKLNKNGKKLWSRSYSASSIVYDLAVSGTTTYLTTGSWICAINDKGYLIWDHVFAEGQLITSVGAKPDGSVIFAGKLGADGFATTFSAQGEKQWEKTYASPGIGNYDNITILGDGSTLLSGTFGGAINITKVGADGTLVKKNEFALPYGIKLNSIEATDGNNVIISATKLGKKSDIVVYKLGF